MDYSVRTPQARRYRVGLLAAMSAIVLTVGIGTPAWAAGDIVYQNHCGVQYTGFHNVTSTTVVASTRRAASGCSGNIGAELRRNGVVWAPLQQTSSNYIVTNGYPVNPAFAAIQGRHRYSGSSYFTTSSSW